VDRLQVTRFDLTVGDVFSVPIDESHVGVGEVVATYLKDAYCFAIFDAAATDAGSIDIDQALQEMILFLALSLDGNLGAGHWTVVGRRPVSEGIPLPAVKVAVGLGGQFDVIDYSGQRRRLASEPKLGCSPPGRPLLQQSWRRRCVPSTASNRGMSTLTSSRPTSP
jgi:Immunity protein 26